MKLKIKAKLEVSFNKTERFGIEGELLVKGL